MKDILYYHPLDSLAIYLFATKDGLAFVGSENGPLDEVLDWYPQATLVANQEILAPYLQTFEAYLNQQTTTFDLPVSIQGTDFQQRVWHALTTIPYGQTLTYSDIAQIIQSPKAVRAVASAIAKNPLLLVIPCHRVIGKNGELRGYRGGLGMKKKLLTFEQNLDISN